MGFNDINLQVSGPQQPASTYKTKVLKGNLSFALQVTEPNTKYVIKHNFVLDGDVTIPANCILEFDGGSISGSYSLTGTDTEIQAGITKIFSTDIILSGTWKLVDIYPQWFGAKADGVTDDGAAVDAMYTFASDNKGRVFFPAGDYRSSVAFAPKSNTITVMSSKATFSGLRPITVGYTFNFSYVNNVVVYFNNAYIDGSNALAHIINFSMSSNVTIYDINIANVAPDSRVGSDHDGVYIGSDSHDIHVVRGFIKDVNRCGIAVTDACNVVVDGVHIEGVGFVSNGQGGYYGTVQAGIDVEPNFLLKCYNIILKNCYIKHCRRGGIYATAGVNIHILNNTVDDCCIGIMTSYGGVANNNPRDGYEKLFITAYDAATGYITLDMEDDAVISVNDRVLYNPGTDGHPAELVAGTYYNIAEINPNNPKQVKLGVINAYVVPTIYSSFTDVPTTFGTAFINNITAPEKTSQIVIEGNNIINSQNHEGIGDVYVAGISVALVRGTIVKNNTIKDFNGNQPLACSGIDSIIEGNTFINIRHTYGVIGYTIDATHNCRIINNRIIHATRMPIKLAENGTAQVDGLNCIDVATNTARTILWEMQPKSRNYIQNVYIQSFKAIAYGITKGTANAVKLKNVTIDGPVTTKYHGFVADDMEFCY